MFEVAVSPVVRLADAVPPAGRSEWLLARATARPPGPDAMRLLAAVDPDALDDVDRVAFLVAWERCARWVEAQRASAVVAVAGRAPADRDDFAREHVRVALLDCGGSPRADVDLARALCGRLAEARAALRRGEISRTHARILFEETRELDDPATAAVTTRVLGRGPRRTPAEFRAAVRRAVIRSDPVRAELAAARASAQRLDAHAARPDTPGPGADQAGADGRTLDQRRFDALVTLCRAALGERPPGRPVPPTAYPFADLATWTGLADDPVHLDGYGPVPPGVARAHLTDARWRALVTDTVTGAALAVADRSYQASARTTRLLHARDRRCAFPGCAAAITFCDADHNQPHAHGGPTDPDNCGPFCRRHHRLKTFTTWTWRRGPDGAIEWTDPHGITWSRDPIRHHMPDPDPPPPEPPPEPPSHHCSSDPPF